jgi:hypothetical protein
LTNINRKSIKKKKRNVKKREGKKGKKRERRKYKRKEEVKVRHLVVLGLSLLVWLEDFG